MIFLANIYIIILYTPYNFHIILTLFVKFSIFISCFLIIVDKQIFVFGKLFSKICGFKIIKHLFIKVYSHIDYFDTLLLIF